MGASPCSPRCLRVGPAQISATASVSLSYCIDPSDHVCRGNQAWRDFAVQNGGGTWLAEHIVGANLWSSMSDHWMAVEEAVNFPGPLDPDPLPRLTYGICADCEIDFLAPGNASGGTPE